VASAAQVDLDAEESVLGALLVDPTRVPEVAGELAAEDFTDSRNRQVFDTMVALSACSQSFDVVMLGAELAQRGWLVSVGGRARLFDLAARVTSSAYLTHHTNIVRDAARLREISAVARRIADEADGVRPRVPSVCEFLEGVEPRIRRAAAARSPGTLELIEHSVDDLQSLINAGPAASPPGLHTGIANLDRILCGLRPSELIVIGARPGVGKTALAWNVAINVALRDERPGVAFFSLEMSRQALLERAAANLAGVNHYHVRNRNLTDKCKADVAAALATLRRASITIDDTREQPIMSIRAKARRFAQRRDLGLVVVDYLQLVSHPGTENRLQEVSAISRALKALAGELKVPVLACAQLGRAADECDRPSMSHLRESGTIEADSDVVILLHPASGSLSPDAPRKFGAIVDKNRNGPTGTVHLRFDPSHLRFTDDVDAEERAHGSGAHETSCSAATRSFIKERESMVHDA
jgi:replicative DNA helicase